MKRQQQCKDTYTGCMGLTVTREITMRDIDRKLSGFYELPLSQKRYMECVTDLP